MTATLVLADYDYPTRSASGFLLRYVLPRMEPVQLYGPLTRRPLFAAVASFSDVILGMGHGLPDTFCGQRDGALLKVGAYQPREVAGKVIKLLSCQSGQELGPDVIAQGALAFQGYLDDYVWICDADKALTPWTDKLAALTILPVVAAMNALLDGATAQEVYDTEQAGYNAMAAETDDELVRACTLFNRDNLVMLGDPHARVRARPRIQLPLGPPPLPPVIPF